MEQQDQVKYVFNDGIEPIAFTKDQLIKQANADGYETSRHLDSMAASIKAAEDLYDTKFKFTVKPLVRLERIHEDDAVLMNVIDLHDQQLPGFEGQAKAIEIIGDYGMPGDTHLLMPYDQKTLSMLKSFDDYQEPEWQQAFDQQLAKAPEHAGSQDLELPKVTADEVSKIVYEKEQPEDLETQKKIDYAKQILQKDYVQDQTNQQVTKFLDSSKVPLDKRAELASRIIKGRQNRQNQTKAVNFDNAEVRYLFDEGDRSANPASYTKDEMLKVSADFGYKVNSLEDAVKTVERITSRKFMCKLNPLLRSQKVYEAPGILINIVDLHNNPGLRHFKNKDKAIEVAGYAFLPSHNRVHLLMQFDKETLEKLKDFRDLKNPKFYQAADQLKNTAPDKVDGGWLHLPLMSDKKMDEITYQTPQISVQKIKPNQLIKKKGQER